MSLRCSPGLGFFLAVALLAAFGLLSAFGCSSSCLGPGIQKPEEALALLRHTVLSSSGYRGSSRETYEQRFIRIGGQPSMFDEAKPHVENSCLQPPRNYHLRHSKINPERAELSFQAFVPGQCPNCWSIVQVTALLDEQCAHLYDVILSREENAPTCSGPAYWPPQPTP